MVGPGAHRSRLEILLGGDLDAGSAQGGGGDPFAGDEGPRVGAVVDLMAAARGGPGLEDGALDPGGACDRYGVLRAPLGQTGHVLTCGGTDAAVGSDLGSRPGGGQPPGHFGADPD